MKHLILVLSIVFVGAFDSLSANNEPMFLTNESKTFKLLLNEWSGNEIQVKIMDEDGIIVLSETLNKSGLMVRKYNLRNLREGKYQVKISNAYKKMVQPIELQSERVVIDKNSAQLSFKPVFLQSENAINLNYLALGEKVSISIMDNYNHTLKTLNYENESSITQRFNLEQLERGSYYVVVSTDDDSFIKEINL